MGPECPSKSQIRVYIHIYRQSLQLFSYESFDVMLLASVDKCLIKSTKFLFHLLNQLISTVPLVFISII